MSVLLGTFGQPSTPFYLYKYKSNLYLSLQDIDFIYFDQQLNTKIKLIKRLFDCNSTEFIKEKSSGKVLVLTRRLIRIARLFNSYCLAELCKLSLDEILGKVAQPLLNNIQSYQWKPQLEFIDQSIEFEPFNGQDWSFLTSTIKKESLFNSSLQSIKINLPCSTQPHSIYKWLSFNLFENNPSPTMVQALISTSKEKKQQQAIIETRQRKSVFHLSNTKHYATLSRPQPRKKLVLLSKPITPKKSTTPLPPSPPLAVDHKRKSFHPEDSKRKKSCPVPTDNLDLLATQATQLRGLPLSPEVSPSPPLFQNFNRLPSLQTMLSELKTQHHFQFYGKTRNMDSCA